MIAPLHDFDDEQQYDVSFRAIGPPTRKTSALSERLNGTGRQRLANAARFSRAPSGDFSGPHRRRMKRSYL